MKVNIKNILFYNFIILLLFLSFSSSFSQYNNNSNKERGLMTNDNAINTIDSLEKELKDYKDFKNKINEKKIIKKEVRESIDDHFKTNNWVIQNFSIVIAVITFMFILFSAFQISYNIKKVKEIRGIGDTIDASIQDFQSNLETKFEQREKELYKIMTYSNETIAMHINPEDKEFQKEMQAIVFRTQTKSYDSIVRAQGISNLAYYGNDDDIKLLQEIIDNQSEGKFVKDAASHSQSILKNRLNPSK